MIYALADSDLAGSRNRMFLNAFVAVLCVGKAAESVFLKPVPAGSSDEPDLKPYTKEGVHYVPKLQMDTILLNGK